MAETIDTVEHTTEAQGQIAPMDVIEQQESQPQNVKTQLLCQAPRTYATAKININKGVTPIKNSAATSPTHGQILDFSKSLAPTPANKSYLRAKNNEQTDIDNVNRAYNNAYKYRQTENMLQMQRQTINRTSSKFNIEADCPVVLLLASLPRW